MKNRTNNSINRAKAKYHKELLFENISKPEKFWKNIKALFPTKSINQCPKSFVIDNHQTTNESEIANGFCLFFHTAEKNLKANSIKLKDFVWSLPKKFPINPAHRFNFRYVSVLEVTRMLKEVNSKRSAGPDQITARLIHRLFHLETSIIPNDFKIGQVSAVYKSGEISQLNNYRPITVFYPSY